MWVRSQIFVEAIEARLVVNSPELARESGSSSINGSLFGPESAVGIAIGFVTATYQD